MVCQNRQPLRCEAAYIQVALDGAGQVLGSVMCIKCPPAARYCQHTCTELDGSSHLGCARSNVALEQVVRLVRHCGCGGNKFKPSAADGLFH